MCKKGEMMPKKDDFISSLDLEESQILARLSAIPEQIKSLKKEIKKHKTRLSAIKIMRENYENRK